MYPCAVKIGARVAAADDDGVGSVGDRPLGDGVEAPDEVRGIGDRSQHVEMGRLRVVGAHWPVGEEPAGPGSLQVIGEDRNKARCDGDHNGPLGEAR